MQVEEMRVAHASFSLPSQAGPKSIASATCACFAKSCKESAEPLSKSIVDAWYEGIGCRIFWALSLYSVLFKLTLE